MTTQLTLISEINVNSVVFYIRVFPKWNGNSVNSANSGNMINH